MFAHLDGQVLRAFEMLGSPLYIYSFSTQRVCWSNAGARLFWNAESEQELLERELTPYSDSTRIRLAEYLDAFRRGENRFESWTYYPRGVATPALSRCTGVRIDGHDECMLVEIRVLSPADMPATELRSIEALRHTPLMISLFSQSGQVLMRNPAAQACFGDLDRSMADDADHFRAMFASAADVDRMLADAAETARTIGTATMALDASPVHTIQLQLVSDPATGKPAMLVAQQDISQLVRMSRQLAASEAALDSVLSLNVAPSLVLSAQDGRILKANFAAQALLGAGVAGEDGVGSFLAEPSQYDSLRGALLAGGSGTVQMRLRAASGASFWASVSGARITYEKQDAIVILVTDIDQLYQQAAELEAALDIERRTSEAQRRFLAIASHEFRTPLAIIDGAAQRLERNAVTLTPDRIRNKATRIRATVKRLLQLLDSTIDRARSNLGAMGYAPATGQIARVIESAGQVFRDNHANLTLDIALPPLPEIVLDAALMEQAFGNLLGNAVKYSQGDPHVVITASASSEDIEILVRDRGIGVPREEWARIFSDYVRGSNVGTIPGTGLGLSLVSQIIGLHGGLIEIVETDGPGTTFRISLPRS